jgi:HIV Tat-specific factor 1
MELITLGEI